MCFVGNSSNLDDNDDYPTLHDLIHVDSNVYFHDGDDQLDQLSFPQPVNLAPAQTGPASFVPAPLIEEPPRRTECDAAIVPTTQQPAPRRKHRAGWQVKVRRLRAQQRDLRQADQSHQTLDRRMKSFIQPYYDQLTDRRSFMNSRRTSPSQLRRVTTHH